MKLKIYIDEGRTKGIFRRGLYKIKRIMRYLYLKTKYRQLPAKIIHSNKAIYFDIPKAATSSIFSLIFKGVYGRDKDNYYEMYKIFPQVREIDLGSKWFNEYYKFSIVRNPYSRIVSCYNDLIINQRVEIIIKELGITENASFKEFVTAISEKNDDELSKLDPHITPQYIFLYKNNNLLVNYFGKVENIEEELDFIFKKIGLNKADKVPILNKSNNSINYREYYNEEIADIVFKRYEMDFKAFKYDKNSYK